MKKILFLNLLLTINAMANEVKVMEPINVDGVVTEAPAEDPELQSIKAEITKQKQDIVLNKKKAQSFKELSKSVEKLSESTEEYLEEKRAAQEEIANYNLKVKCMQSETPGPECSKTARP